MYIALMCKRDNLGKGVKHPAAFTHKEKDAVVQLALRARADYAAAQAWSTAHYDIFVGELTQEVTQPVTYSLLELKTL